MTKPEAYWLRLTEGGAGCSNNYKLLNIQQLSDKERGAERIQREGRLGRMLSTKRLYLHHRFLQKARVKFHGLHIKGALGVSVIIKGKKTLHNLDDLLSGDMISVIPPQNV